MRGLIILLLTVWILTAVLELSVQWSVSGQSGEYIGLAAYVTVLCSVLSGCVDAFQ